MTEEENLLRTAHFAGPDWIPMRFHINPSCWEYYPQQALQELMADHPQLFPGFKVSPTPIRPKYAPWQCAGKSYVDSWGCTWRTTQNGITGTVVKHPLEDWENFSNYLPPNPHKEDGWGPINWRQKKENLRKSHAEGRIRKGSLRHGHTFMTLTYIRGYKNLIFDMADEKPQLYRLIGMVEDFNMGIVQRYVHLGVKWMGYPEDLGMQVGPLISPQYFGKYIKPVYQHLMAPAAKAGCIIHMHSDGDIRTLVNDIMDCGVGIINLQDLVNGIDWIKKYLKGRVCIDLDIDRQNITRFGTPSQIRSLIRREVEKLGSKKGGLMMTHGLYPGIPLANIKALMDAMEEYAGYYS